MTDIERGPRGSAVAGSADITSAHYHAVGVGWMHPHHHAIGLITGSGCGGRGFGFPSDSAIAALVEGHGRGIESESFEDGVDYFGEFMTIIELYGSVGAGVGGAGEGNGFEGAGFAVGIGGYDEVGLHGGHHASVGKTNHIGDLFISAIVSDGPSCAAID